MSQVGRHVNWAGSSPAGSAWSQLQGNGDVPAGDFTPTNHAGGSSGTGSRVTGSDPSPPGSCLNEQRVIPPMHHGEKRAYGNGTRGCARTPRFKKTLLERRGGVPEKTFFSPLLARRRRASTRRSFSRYPKPRQGDPMHPEFYELLQKFVKLIAPCARYVLLYG